MVRSYRRHPVVSLLLLLAAVFCGAASAQVPHTLTYQGYLTNAVNQPLNAAVTVVFKLYDVASGGAALHTETQSVTPANGVFNAVLGTATPLVLPFDVPYFLGVTVGADPEMTPRQPLVASPYAFRAAGVDATAALPAAQITGSVATTQIANNAVTQAKLSPLSGAAAQKVLGTDGTNLQWQTAATGTVTSVTASTGLTGGVITTAGTIAADTTYLQRRVSGSCAVGSYVRAIAADGTVTCAADANSGGTLTSIAAGTGLTGGTITTTGTIAADTTYLQRRVSGSCVVGTYVRAIAADGTVTCAADTNSGGTVTSITAGAGLTGGLITTTGTIAVDPASTTLTTNFFKRGGNAFGAIGGTAVIGTTDNNALNVLVNNARVLRIEPTVSPNFIAGHSSNAVTAGVVGATIGGGGVLAGGLIAGSGNTVTDDFGTIAGGTANRAGDGIGLTDDAIYNTVGGGFGNIASGYNATIGGGRLNVSSALSSTVSGGANNTATGGSSTVGGGTNNTANGGTIPGGASNSATTNAFAAGQRAKAVHADSFVWGGSPTSDTTTLAVGDFVVYAPGAVRLFAGPAGSGGCTLNTGAGGWACASDRNLKENFEPLNGPDVLSRLSRLPVTRWNVKTVPGVQHIGPMAQDFHRAFGLGIDNQHIGTTDAQGVALAAIQALYKLVQDKDRQIKRLEAKSSEVDHLKKKLAAIEAKLGLK